MGDYPFGDKAGCALLRIKTERARGEWWCAISPNDGVWAARRGHFVEVCVESDHEEINVMLTPSDAREMAAELIRLADEVEGK